MRRAILPLPHDPSRIPHRGQGARRCWWVSRRLPGYRAAQHRALEPLAMGIEPRYIAAMVRWPHTSNSEVVVSLVTTDGFSDGSNDHFFNILFASEGIWTVCSRLYWRHVHLKCNVWYVILKRLPRSTRCTWIHYTLWILEFIKINLSLVLEISAQIFIQIQT